MFAANNLLSTWYWLFIGVRRWLWRDNSRRAPRIHITKNVFLFVYICPSKHSTQLETRVHLWIKKYLILITYNVVKLQITTILCLYFCSQKSFQWNYSHNSMIYVFKLAIKPMTSKQSIKSDNNTQVVREDINKDIIVKFMVKWPLQSRIMGFNWLFM